MRPTPQFDGKLRCPGCSGYGAVDDEWCALCDGDGYLSPCTECRARPQDENAPYCHICAVFATSCDCGQPAVIVLHDGSGYCAECDDLARTTAKAVA